jgi:hypothetical protein
MQSNKKIQKPMKVRYPDGQSKEHYIRFLISKYWEQCPQVSEEQIRIPINKVISLIALAIELNQTIKSKIEEINFLKKFANEDHFQPEQSIFDAQQYYVSLYCFKEGMKNAPFIALSVNDLPFPDEHEKEYLRFTKNMSCEAIDGITQATEDFIKVISGKENLDPMDAMNRLKPSKKRVSFFFDEAKKEENCCESPPAIVSEASSKPQAQSIEIS